MNDNILLFLEAYKDLDELCKQTLSSEKGISQYIDEMKMESTNHPEIPGWNSDYQELKRLRWIRNQLVHEPDSFRNIQVMPEDIKWLNDFRLRILKCYDPFSLLYQVKNTKTANNMTNTNSSDPQRKTEAPVQEPVSNPRCYVHAFVIVIICVLLILTVYYSIR